MNPLRKSCAFVLASAIAALPAIADASCVARDDLHALQNAALQQRLMVSAFQCHDLQLYNAFVLNHRPQLQSYDAALLAFFKRDDPKGGDAAYNAYKTHLANIAALEDAHSNTFCDDVAGLYVQVGGSSSLDPVLDSLPVTDTAYASCEAPDTNMPVIASNPVTKPPPPPPPVTPPPIVEASITPPPPVTQPTEPDTDTATVQNTAQPTKRLTPPGRAVKWLGGWLRKATSLVGLGDSDDNASAPTNADTTSSSTAAAPAPADTSNQNAAMAYQPAPQSPAVTSTLASSNSAPAWDPNQPLIADQDQTDSSARRRHKHHHKKRTEDDPLYGDDDSSSDSNYDYGR